MKRIGLIILAVVSTLICLGQDLPTFASLKSVEVINTSAEEAKPVFSADASKMYFVRAYHEENVGYSKSNSNEDIWEVEKDENGEWNKIVNEKELNDFKNNSIIGQGKDNHFYLLNTYQKDEELEYGIAMSNKLAEHKWTKPEIIPIPNLKYTGNFYDFYITQDEEVLLISIAGEDTKGEEDLYVSVKEDGKWTEPKNIGDKINTTGYEFSPYLSADKRFLYYSTNGRNDGFGGADVYVSERLDDTWLNWSEPKNLGDVVNSSAIDCYFTINSNNEYFLASSRDGKDLNIYQAIVKVDTVIEEIVDTVEVVDTMALAKEVIEEVVTTVVENPVTEEEIVIEKPEVEIVLKRVLHPFNESSQTANTKVNLDDVISAMNNNPYLTIQIESHTDSKGDDKYNMELSKRRALGAKTYLIRNGISGSRIKVKWFGESQPVANNENADGSDNPDGRAQNRRTEFKILTEKP